MERVVSLSEYFELINRTKAEKGMLKTNCMLFPDAVSRYIELGRLYVESVEAGLLFYTDEERFYQVWFQIRPEIPFTVGRKEKPVLLQNVYKGEKKPWLLQTEDSFKANGFVLKDTMKQGIFTAYDRIPKIIRAARPIERIFREEGLTLMAPSREQLPELRAFCGTIREIPYWQFPYYTDDEMMEEAASGRLYCVTDSGGKIIGARHLILSGKKLYGWVGVEEKYKTAYGVAMMFLKYALEYIQENDLKMCSLVDLSNTPSLEYHERMGTEWTGQLVDEWVLE